MTDSPTSPMSEPVAWEIYVAGAGSINSQHFVTLFKSAADRWREDGAEVEPLYPASTVSALRTQIARLEEALRVAQRAIEDMRLGIHIHNERKQYGPIEGAVPDALTDALMKVRAALAQPKGEADVG